MIRQVYNILMVAMRVRSMLREIIPAHVSTAHGQRLSITHSPYPFTPSNEQCQHFHIESFCFSRAKCSFWQLAGRRLPSARNSSCLAQTARLRRGPRYSMKVPNRSPFTAELVSKTSEGTTCGLQHTDLSFVTGVCQRGNSLFNPACLWSQL